MSTKIYKLVKLSKSLYFSFLNNAVSPITFLFIICGIRKKTIALNNSYFTDWLLDNMRNNNLLVTLEITIEK